MTEQRKAILSLHFIVVLWSFTAILGDLISLSAFWLVWWRIGLTCLSLIALPRVLSNSLQISRRVLMIYSGVGVLIALHWITFFGAIKYANASIGLIALSVTALITSVIEPLFTRSRIDPIDVICGVMVVPGMFLVVNGLESDGILGLLIGFSSALFAALFAVFNKMVVAGADTKTMTFVELSSAWIFLTVCSPAVLYWQPDAVLWPTGWDWPYLIVLAVVCTAVAFIWHLEVLKHLSAFASNLIINLEPVYGIILAAVLLNDRDELTGQFYIGVGVIMLVVAIYPILKKRFSRNL